MAQEQQLLAAIPAAHLGNRCPQRAQLRQRFAQAIILKRRALPAEVQEAHEVLVSRRDEVAPI